MKKFVTRVFSIIALLLVVSGMLQLAVSLRIRHKSIYGQDNFHIINNQQNDVVFLGSSRCTRHFDPKFFRDSLGISSVNIGVTGHGDLTMQMIRLKYYLAHNKPPKIALLNYDPLCAYGPYDYSLNNNFVEKNFYARYAFLPTHDDKMIVQYFHFNLAEQYIPLYAMLRYRNLPDVIRMTGGKIWLRDGFKKDNTRWDTVKYPVDKTQFTSAYATYVHNEDSTQAHLASFNAYCKSNNITLVCVQSPVYKTIYDKQTFDVTDSICHHLGILFIDTNEPSIINDVGNFSDLDHLNTYGVPKMLNIVVKDTGFLALLHKRLFR